MLEDYELPTIKVCPRGRDFRDGNCRNYEINLKGNYCSYCGTELVIEEVPLTIKIRARLSSFRGKKEDQINKEIEMDLDDFIRLLKSRWENTIPKQLSFMKDKT